MNEADVIDLLRDAMWTTLLMAGPGLLIAMVVGVGIALIQALTQVQEMTLTFVPKIVAIFLVVIMALPFMYAALATHMHHLSDRIAAGG